MINLIMCSDQNTLVTADDTESACETDQHADTDTKLW
jgi:hypothetical protein